MTDTICDRFERYNAARYEQLQKARKCAALTIPSILKPEGFSEGETLPEPFQAIGQYGLNNMLGRLLISMFDPSLRWFAKELDPELRFTWEQQENFDDINKAEGILRLHELMTYAYIDCIGSRGNNNRRHSGFLTQKRRSLMQELVTGSTLERLDDNGDSEGYNGAMYFSLRVFPRDSYCTRRDQAGSVLEHVTCEMVDPLSLPPKVLEASKLDTGAIRDKQPSERMEDLYTAVQWQPATRKWTIRQEVNKNEVNESEETVSQYFPGEFDLVIGEHEGRGFVESIYPDLASYDQLRERILDWAGMASKNTPVLDYNADMRETELEKKSGVPIRCRVTDGRPQDFGMLTVQGVPNFQVIKEVHAELRGELGQLMLLESETGPGGEAMRSPVAWQTVSQQLRGGLGGLYATMVDDHQLPLIERVEHRLIAKGKFDGIQLPKEASTTRTLTGFAALAAQAQMGEMTTLAQSLGQLSPESLKGLDFRAYARAWQRLKRIEIPGFIKTDDKLAAEAQAQIAQETQLAANQQIIKSGGNIAEGAAAQQQAQ